MVKLNPAGLLFLGQPFFITWNDTVRPDMLFLMVMLLSLFCAVAGDSFGGAGCVLSGVLLGSCSFSWIKQPGIAVPIAVLDDPATEFRTAAASVASSAVLPVLVFGVLLWHRGPFLGTVWAP